MRRASDKQVTKTMTGLAKSLRDPLNWLNIRLNRAGAKGGLTAGLDDFGLGKVRATISNGDLEGVDGTLNHLLALLQTPANTTALTAQDHAPADTKAFADARQRLSTFNTTQNTNQNAALELTDENLKAGNALWTYIADVLGTGNLMYKATNPKKDRTYAAATLLKRIRKEHAVGDVPADPMSLRLLLPMKPLFRLSRTAALTLLLPLAARAQSVDIGTTAPDFSAALDVTSTTKGLLVPRVAITSAMASPAPGLLVYQTGAPAGFYYNADTAAAPGWQQLGAAASGSFDQNTTPQQTGSNFNISGDGTLTGTLTATNAVLGTATVATALTGSGASIVGAFGPTAA